MKTILIVDDEPRTREGVKKTISTWSSGRCRIETAASGLEALEWLQAQEAQLVVTDIRMPELGGLELIERIHHRSRPPAIIVISGYSEFELARQALRFGVVDYLLKPLDKEQLVGAVEAALAKEENMQRVLRMEQLIDVKLLETAGQEKAYVAKVQEALRYIDQHLQDPLSLRETAYALHMNSSYLSVLFKEQTGLTFSEYLTHRRVQRARELLVGTSMPVAEIAEQVGYQTARYFVKVFRSLEGLSPGQYRQSLSDPDEQI